jgi:hypothetical protein
MPLMNSYQIVNTIIEELFKAENRRLQKWLNDIVTANFRESNLAQPVGFIYGGAYFRPDWQGQGQFPKRALHSSLWGQMDNWIKDRSIILDDKQMISQILFGLIEKCSSDSEIRNALPECLVNCIPQYRSMTRSREEAWTIKLDDRRYRQYRKILPKIELYAVTMLIY